LRAAAGGGLLNLVGMVIFEDLFTHANTHPHGSTAPRFRIWSRALSFSIFSFRAIINFYNLHAVDELTWTGSSKLSRQTLAFSKWRCKTNKVPEVFYWKSLVDD